MHIRNLLHARVVLCEVRNKIMTTASVGSTSSSHVLHLAPAPPLIETPTQSGFEISVLKWQPKNEASIYRTAKNFSIEGGRNSERKCCILHISPPPALCTKAKAKRGAYLWDTMVFKQVSNPQKKCSNKLGMTPQYVCTISTS